MPETGISGIFLCMCIRQSIDAATKYAGDQPLPNGIRLGCVACDIDATLRFGAYWVGRDRRMIVDQQAAPGGNW